jgi:predicted MPP superfamily phosphohydrolase
MGYFRLRRARIFDPLTPLDKFLLSPLCAIVQRLYIILLFLRGAPFQPPKNKPSIRIVCISDTHTHTPQIPDGDLLIHAGDMTNAGTVKDIQAQLDWLNSLPHKHKVIIAGNHDSYFDPKSRQSVDKASGAKLNYYNIHYLENQSLQLKFKGPRLLNLYGSPDIPQCGGSDFALVFLYFIAAYFCEFLC